MTISSETRKAGPYHCNGATTNFAFSFKVFVATDVVVTKLVVATGVQSTFVLNTDYTVSLNADQNANPGGSVTTIGGSSPYATGNDLTITSAVPRKQETDITNGGGFYPNVIEDALDREVILVQQDREILDRSLRYPVSDPSLGVELPAAAQRALKSIKFDASGNVIPTTYDPDSQVAAAEASAAAAAASAASAAAAVFGFRDVLFITFADSPYTIGTPQFNKLISVDTSGGAVVVNLPLISGLTLPGVVGVKKTTSDTNTVTINRAGSDVFDDGSTSKVIASVGGTALTPDTDPTPDKWSTADFGAGVGNQQKQQFTAGAGFTAGVSTTITLTETPLSSSKDALQIYFDGAYQQESEWSYNSGSGVVTFNSVIPGSVAKIQAVWISPLAIGTPADGTVSAAKLAYSAVHGQTAETAPAIDDELLVGDTSAAALRLMTLANILKVLNGLTEDASPDRTADFLLEYDASASAVKKVKFDSFVPPGAIVGYASTSLATVQSCSTGIPYDDTIPQITEGDEILSSSYSPKYTNSIIRVTALVQGATSASTGVYATIALFVDATANALAVALQGQDQGVADNPVDIALHHEEVSASLTARTYRIRASANSGTFHVNGNSSGSRKYGGVRKAWLVIEEIKQ